MNINIRMEGGLGDHLVANRFVPAILDKHPSAKIKIFSDTEGNHRSLDTILDLFGNFYVRGGEVIKERQNKNYLITTQFGTENYPAHINNQKPEILNRMMDCDKFYDLHIDGLNWLSHDYDWLRYFYHFPKPHKTFPGVLYNDKYIMAHLYARPDSPYNLEQNYVLELINKLTTLCKVVVITEDKYTHYYQSLASNSQVIINTTSNIENIFNIASNCLGFIGIDSGIRYIPYHYSKPTFVLSGYCSSYGEVAYSHLIRWLIFKQYVLPMHTNVDIVSKLFYNIKQNTSSCLFPEILDNIERYIIQR